MGTKIILLALGLAIGLGVGMFIKDQSAVTSAPDSDVGSLEARVQELTAADEAKAERVSELEKKIMEAETARIAAEGKVAGLETRVAELTAEEVPAAPAAVEERDDGVVTFDELKKTLGKLGQSFQAHMLGRNEDLEKEIRETWAKASAEDVAKAIEYYGGLTDVNSKLVMAHLLGMSHRPEALKALEDIVRDKDQNMMERRLASHGLAFSGAESLKPLLREMAKEDPDRGTRANSAFGLYRMNDPEAVDLYFKATDEAFAEKDPNATQYLGGLTLMDDRALPAARERLKTYENWQAKIALIMFIQGRKDKGSLNLLTGISRDENQKAEVRAAADAAIKSIEAADE